MILLLSLSAHPLVIVRIDVTVHLGTVRRRIQAPVVRGE